MSQVLHFYGEPTEHTPFDPPHVGLEDVGIGTADGGIWLAGISDDMVGLAEPEETISPLRDGNPIIALSHSPAVFPDIDSRAVLTLAGHTHGGQASFPLIGALYLPGRSPLRYAYGHIRENGKDMYVTAGVGNSILPIRFNMPPEIALITVVSSDR